jgi:hypothetical protein
VYIRNKDKISAQLLPKGMNNSCRMFYPKWAIL